MKTLPSDATPVAPLAALKQRILRSHEPRQWLSNRKHGNHERSDWSSLPQYQTKWSHTPLVGAIGFAYHFTEFEAAHPFESGVVWIELLRLLAILCGAYLFLGQDWARWLALAWIAFHVILSAFHLLPEFAIHSLFCGVIAWCLFRPAVTPYFRVTA